jgi:hypothetical protein
MLESTSSGKHVDSVYMLVSLKSIRQSSSAKLRYYYVLYDEEQVHLAEAFEIHMGRP